MNKSKEHLENMARGVPFNSRNLPFIINDMSFSDIDEMDPNDVKYGLNLY